MLEKRVREELEKRALEIEVFSGMKEAIDTLRASGCSVGVLSSNNESIVRNVFKKYGITVDFIHAGSRFFGKARALRRLLKSRSLESAQGIYVGDELRDIGACKKVGMGMVAVGWGFNNPDALRKAGVRVASDPAELLTLLLSHD